MKHIVITLFAVALAADSPLYAHHSFAADYFEDQTVSVAGDVMRFEYRSPHAWVHIMAMDENGQMQTYSAEWFSAPRLKLQGVEADAIKAGDHVIITGAPGRRADEHRIHLKRIERPADGWTFGRGPGRGGFGRGRFGR